MIITTNGYNIPILDLRGDTFTAGTAFNVGGAEEYAKVSALIANGGLARLLIPYGSDGDYYDVFALASFDHDNDQLVLVALPISEDITGINVDMAMSGTAAQMTVTITEPEPEPEPTPGD